MKAFYLPLTLLLLPGLVAAQEGRPAPLTEIVVTAHKREQSVARVPASVLVSDAARLEGANLNRLDELAEFLPGLAVSDTGIGSQLAIRGMASGNNPAFEQSVGQYLDGVHLGRAALTALPFLDLQRVEMLRGPQSILLGKNAVAGALNLVSARPSPERFAQLRGLYGFDTAQREYEGVLSAPAGAWNTRLAWRSSREDGWLYNTTLGATEPARGEDALRLSLARDFTDAAELLIKLEGGRFDGSGAALEIVRDDPGQRPPGLDLATAFTVLGLPAPESRQDYRRQGGLASSRTNVRGLTVEMAHTGPARRLTWLGALFDYDFARHCDCDFTPAPLFETRQHEDYRQFSQELRLQSAAPGPREWLLGALFHASMLDASDALAVMPYSAFARLAALPGAADLARLPGSGAVRDNRQEARALSFFLQHSWAFAADWRLTLGARQTWERKTARRQLDLVDSSQNPLDDNALALLYRDQLGIHSRQLRTLHPDWDHALRGRRQEAQFAPLLRLERDIGHGGLYLGATSGYKGGGFDARANNPHSFEFEEEAAHSLEAGIKSLSRDGTLEFNVALFATRYRDLQISQFDGALGFNVGNAAAARAFGVELDGRWALSPALRLGYAGSWLDFAYTDFRNGNCPNRRPPDGVVLQGVALCDFSGEVGKYAPRERLSFTLDYQRPLHAARLRLWAALNYRSAQQVHDNLDPLFKVAPALRLHLGVALEQGAWRLALIARNLGANAELTHAGNVPLSNLLFGSNTFYAQVARPRQIALEAAWHLGN